MYTFNNRNDLRKIPHGAKLTRVRALDPEHYDALKTGPMFTARVEELSVDVHLFLDEITCHPAA